MRTLWIAAREGSALLLRFITRYRDLRTPALQRYGFDGIGLPILTHVLRWMRIEIPLPRDGLEMLLCFEMVRCSKDRWIARF